MDGSAERVHPPLEAELRRGVGGTFLLLITFLFCPIYFPKRSMRYATSGPWSPSYASCAITRVNGGRHSREDSGGVACDVSHQRRQTALHLEPCRMPRRRRPFVLSWPRLQRPRKCGRSPDRCRSRSSAASR